MEIDQTLDLKRENGLDRLSIAVSTIIFTLLIILVSLQVVLRVLNLPFNATWTEPISRFLFIIGTYFGAALASRNNEHVRLTLVREQFLSNHKRGQKVLDIITALAIVLFVVVATWALLQATIEGWDTKALGGATTLTAGHIYLGIAIGFVLMGIYEIQNLIIAVRDLLDRETTLVDSDTTPDTQEGGQ